MTVLFPIHRTAGPVAADSRVAIRPATELTSMTRYRGGTYSHTVQKIAFTDGSWARTDLIRLNPNVPAYSLDFTGVAPRHPSRYHPGRGRTCRTYGHRARSPGVDWILRHSYPLMATSELSRRVREPAIDRAGQHQRARSDRGHAGCDLVLDQRIGPGHPAAQRAGRRSVGPAVG